MMPTSNSTSARMTTGTIILSTILVVIIPAAVD
jgi:hypothetical protein